MKIKNAILLAALASSSVMAQDNLARPGFTADNKQPLENISGVATIENFDDVTTLPGNGWVIDNRSDMVPGAAEPWVQGAETVFPAHMGAPNAFTSANFNVTAGSTICAYLIMPDLGPLQTVSFWTRTATDSTFPDRMVVLHSPSGGINTGDCVNGFGDFTNTLVEVNPNLDAGGYPDADWTQFTANVNGTGRVAFVYWVTDAGPVGSNSNFIGLDTVEWVAGAAEADLSLNVTNNASGELAIGDVVTFTKTLSNAGPGDANNAVVNSTLSNGLTYTSNDCGATASGSDITWNVGTVANGATAMCNVVATVSGFGQLSLTASASADEDDTVPGNNAGGSTVNGPVRVIPTLSQYGIMLLLAGLFFFGRRKLA